MADRNVHLTEADAREIANNINKIGGMIQSSEENINDTMQFLIGNSAGEEVDLLKDFGLGLCKAIGQLAVAALDTGYKIGEYINAMIANDHDAAQKIKESFFN